MDSSIIVITIIIALLAIATILTFIVKEHKQEGRLSPLAGIAFGCILAGLFTGNDQFISCSLLGVGVVLAIVDIIRKSRQSKHIHHLK